MISLLLLGCASAEVVGNRSGAPLAEPYPEVRLLSREPANLPVIRLPFAARQMDEGYWLGAMIQPDDVDTLGQLGIRLVISAVQPSAETLQALERAGIRQVSVPIGVNFRFADRILEATQTLPPPQIFIHCRHGADRTGAIAAFLLVIRHHWLIADAFYSVLYPTQQDVLGLAVILQRFGILDFRHPDDPTVGFYSVSATGTAGGLKVRNQRYAQLVVSTIEAIRDWMVDTSHPDFVNASVAPR